MIIGASFLIGFIMRVAIARRAGNWAEDAVLRRLPIYNLLKTVTTSLTESEKEDAFVPALMTLPNGNRVLVTIMEDHGDELLTVFQPSCPTPTIGTVQLVERERVQPLDIKLLDITKVMGQWGVGMHELLKEKK